MTERSSTVHWHVFRKPNGKYAVLASEQRNARQRTFDSLKAANEFASMMQAQSICDQRTWINTRLRGSGSAKVVYSTKGRMQTEWAKTHPQVRVVGGWRGRPCGGGHVGINGRNVLARA